MHLSAGLQRPCQLSSLARYARVSPEPSAAGRHSATRHSAGFRFAAGLAWRRRGAEVQVLEGNLRRVIGVEASGGELRALSRQAMRSYARYWLEAFRLPVVPVDRLVGVPVDQRGPVIARYREAAGRVAGPVFAKLPDARDHPVSRIDSNPGR